MTDPRIADAALASYTAGLLTAAVCMALCLAPRFVVFLAGYFVVSLVTSWAITDEEPAS